MHQVAVLCWPGHDTRTSCEEIRLFGHHKLACKRTNLFTNGQQLARTAILLALVAILRVARLASQQLLLQFTEICNSLTDSFAQGGSISLLHAVRSTLPLHYRLAETSTPPAVMPVPRLTSGCNARTDIADIEQTQARCSFFFSFRQYDMLPLELPPIMPDLSRSMSDLAAQRRGLLQIQILRPYAYAFDTSYANADHAATRSSFAVRQHHSSRVSRPIGSEFIVLNGVDTIWWIDERPWEHSDTTTMSNLTTNV